MSNRLIVFSGGSAANAILDVFRTLCTGDATPLRRLDFVLPISDNGGSTSEILRVFGGPGIGDVRSRLIRLAPDDPDDPELAAIKHLLNHRLDGNNALAKLEWLELAEGMHSLWSGISSDKKELLRSFLTLTNLELVKRQRPNSAFTFTHASVGNLFLTGARIFFGSFESAIYLFRSITSSATSDLSVLPCINSNFAHHIAAGLADGSVVVGQNEISHPSTSAHASCPSEISAEEEEVVVVDRMRQAEHDEHDEVEDANLPGSLRQLRQRNIEFSKSAEQTLPARIERVWYINPYGQEILPPANPKVVAALKDSKAVIYSIGSLYTSLVPCLVPRGVGAAIAASGAPKILLLNGCNDRETEGFDGADYVEAIVRACAGKDGDAGREKWRRYVSHVIYLEGNGVPKLDAAGLRAVGIEALRVYGPRGKKGMVYDPVPLVRALATILGKGAPKGTESRRNTVNGCVEVLRN